MFFRKKTKNRDRFPMPDWMKWVVLAFLGFAFLGSLHHKNGGKSSETIPQALSNAAQNLSPKKLIPLDSYKNILPPQKTGISHPAPRATETLPETLPGIKDTTIGKGTPAVCGREVTIAYTAYNKNDKLTGNGRTAAFRIGAGKAPPVLEEGVVGMKKGGKRTIYSADERFEAELLSATPPIPDADDTPYHIAIATPGNGAPVLCGRPATFQITLWSMDGKKLFSTKDKGQPITFTPGQSEVFFGLEQGVIGMRRGEMRTLIVPPAFQKTMDGNPPKVAFPLPKDQTVLVDVEALP